MKTRFTKSNSGLIGALTPLLIIIVLAIGEIRCIVKFCQCDFEPSYKAEIIYGVSMCTGIGMITGYINFGK